LSLKALNSQKEMFKISLIQTENKFRPSSRGRGGGIELSKIFAKMEGNKE